MEYKLRLHAVMLALLWGAAFCRAAQARTDLWQTGFGVGVQYGGVLGTLIGINPNAHDGYDGSGFAYYPDDVGIFTIAHYVQGEHDWNGPTGYQDENYERTPIQWGGSKTWWNFYLWAQHYTPPASGQIAVRNGYEPGVGLDPPAGYIGHIVIDQIPAGVTWNGPMDYWFDMTVRNNTFLMPIAEVSDPLQGTRFHLTVYTPEPSSLLALAAGIGALGGIARGRRRKERG